MKWITAITWFIIALLGSWIYLATYYAEITFPLYPLIDTKLPPGFSEAKFASIKVGMTKAEVLKILPAPVPRREYKEEEWGVNDVNDNSWYYGQDGAIAPFGDFGWFEFGIEFDEEGKVVAKNTRMNPN